MRFSSIAELMEYVNIIGEDRLSEMEVSFTSIPEPNISNEGGEVSDVAVPTITESVIEIKSLSNSPSITVALDESIDSNVLYVEDYDSVPLACSTGKVTFLGRTIYANICESSDGPSISLNILLDHTEYTVPFKLIKTCDVNSDYIMLLNPKLLSPYE